jgi:hypothetical protein
VEATLRVPSEVHRWTSVIWTLVALGCGGSEKVRDSACDGPPSPSDTPVAPGDSAADTESPRETANANSGSAETATGGQTVHSGTPATGTGDTARGIDTAPTADTSSPVDTSSADTALTCVPDPADTGTCSGYEDLVFSGGTVSDSSGPCTVCAAGESLTWSGCLENPCPVDIEFYDNDCVVTPPAYFDAYGTQVVLLDVCGDGLFLVTADACGEVCNEWSIGPFEVGVYTDREGNVLSIE